MTYLCVHKSTHHVENVYLCHMPSGGEKCILFVTCQLEVEDCYGPIRNMDNSGTAHASRAIPEWAPGIGINIR